MSFVFYQLRKKIDCQDSFLFLIPLLIFDENGMFLLTTTQKKCYSFTCSICATDTVIDFNKIVNAETIIFMKETMRDEMEIANKSKKTK